MEVNCQHVACEWSLNENPNLQKKKKIKIWDFFIQNWEKSHLNSIGNGANFCLRTQKKSGHIVENLMSQLIYGRLHSSIALHMLDSVLSI